jgi:hypothetical protein
VSLNIYRQAITVDATATTDSKGNAHLTVPGTGDFRITPKYPIPAGALASGSSGVNIFIDPYKPNSDASNSIAMKWPYTMLRAKQFRGHLMLHQVNSSRVALGLNPLVIHDALSYVSVANSKTLTDGAFDFPNLSAGLYFLQIVPVRPDSPTDVAGNIPIYLNPDSPTETLEIGITYSDCGLQYELLKNTDGTKQH